MTTLVDRIQEIIDSGFTQAEITKAAGVTKGTTNQWLDGKIKSMKLEYAVGIQTLTGFNAAWIVLGKGAKKISEIPILQLKDDEAALLNIYRTSDPIMQFAIMTAVKAMASKASKLPPDPPKLDPHQPTRGKQVKDRKPS